MQDFRAQPPAIRAAFGETVDPSRHVARPATEEVLDRLEAFCCDADSASPLAALIVPPGFGKTHLLRVLEARLAVGAVEADGRSSSVLYLPYAALSLPDLMRWIEGLLGRDRSERRVDALDPESALAGLARWARARATTLVLLIDDADAMPEATVRGLAQSIPGAADALRIVLALSDDSRAVRLLAALERAEPIEVHFRAALDEPETEAYLRARLAGAGLEPAVLDGLDPVTVARICALSAGIPRRLHRVASALLEPDRAALASALALHSRSHAWLGAPLGDLV